MAVLLSNLPALGLRLKLKYCRLGNANALNKNDTNGWEKGATCWRCNTDGGYRSRNNWTSLDDTRSAARRRRFLVASGVGGGGFVGGLSRASLGRPPPRRSRHRPFDDSSSPPSIQGTGRRTTCRKSFSLFWPSWANGVDGSGVPGAEDSLATNAVGASGEGFEIGERGLCGSLTTRSS